MQQHALFVAQRTDGGDVLDHADLVVDVHDRGENGVGAQGLREPVEVEQAVRLRIEVGDLEAFALQFAEAVQHRLVFGLAGDEVFAFLARRSAPRP